MGAAIDLSKSIQMGVNDARIYVERGAVDRAVSASNHAITDFTEALRLDPNEPQAFFKRA
jgi:hypothetical protein